MAEYDVTTVSLPRDPAGRRFMGVSGKMFRAFKTSEVVNTDEELAVATGLVGTDGTTPLIGQAAKAGSLPVTLASDDDLQAKIGIVTETAPGTDTASSGLNGRLQRIAQRLTSLIALFPTSLGQQLSANSFPVVLANNAALPIGNNVLGKVKVRNTADTEDIDPLSEVQFIDLAGAKNETAPASDTAAVGLNGRLQRIAQNITTLLGRFPTSLGQQTGANSFPVVLSSSHGLSTEANQVALGSQVGQTNETAPASDTATSGINGRLQRIAQRLTTLIAGSDAQNLAVSDSDEGAEASTDEAAFAAATGLRYFGFSARETTESGAAVFNIRRGTDNTGAIMDTVRLGPGESAREWYGPCGIEAAAGIWLERVSGTCQVIVRGKVM